MNKFWSLVKVVLKNSSEGMSNGKNKKNSKFKNVSTVGKVILALIIFAPVFFSFYQMNLELFNNLKASNAENALMALIVPGASIAVFIFSIMMVMSVFYFSMDIEYFLPMPIKPSTIVGAKFVAVLIYEYYIEALILLPPIAVYALNATVTPVFYVYALIVLLILPVFPIVISSIISLVIMTFSKGAKNKDRFTLISSFIGILFALGINLVMPKMTSSSPEAIKSLIEISQGKNTWSNIFKNVFPTSNFAIGALNNSSNLNGFGNLMFLIAATIISILVFMFLANKLYFKGVIGITESSSKRKALTDTELTQASKKNSKFMSYTWKEVKLILRTPVYLMNCVLGGWFGLIIGGVCGIQGAKSSASKGEAINFSEMLNEVTKALSNDDAKIIFFMIVIGVATVLASMTLVASTAISREGKNVTFMKYIPMSVESQIGAKVLSGIILTLPQMLIVFIVIGFLIKPPTVLFLLSILASALVLLFSNLFGMLIDIMFPKLDWDSEIKAVKQNFNGVIQMFGTMLVMGLMIYLSFKFLKDLKYMVLGMTLVLITINYVLYILVNKIGKKKLLSIN